MYTIKEYVIPPGLRTDLMLPFDARMLHIGLSRTYGQTPERPVVLYVLEQAGAALRRPYYVLTYETNAMISPETLQEGADTVFYLGTVQPMPGVVVHLFGDIPPLAVLGLPLPPPFDTVTE